MDQIEPAGAPPFIEPALIEPAQIGPAPPVPCPIDPSSIVPAYRLARLGFVLVPLVTGILVAVPLAVLCWALFAGYGIGLTQGLSLLCLIPAALLVVAASARIEPPGGLSLHAADAPELFGLIENLRAYVGAPRLDAITLAGSFTVRCLQRPDHGLFGSWRNELVVGLPLLSLVSKGEAAVLIVHELAKLSPQQDKRSAEVHRARVVWQLVNERLAVQPAYLRVPFALVTGSFSRRFLAASARSERANVFAADRQAAEIAGPATTASALLRLKIAESFLGSYWAEIGAHPVTSPDPDLTPYRDMAHLLPRLDQWPAATGSLQATLGLSASPDAASPALAERLAALDVVPDLPACPAQSAARLLGPSLVRAADHFDAAWRIGAKPTWRAAYDRLSPDTRRLLDLEARAARQPLDLAAAIERAQLALAAGGLDAARGRFADAIEWHPSDARAALAAAIAMIDCQDQDGLDCLQQALELAPRTDWAKADAESWFNLGQALLLAGQDIGIDCLEQAIRIDALRTDLAAFLVDRYLDGDSSAANAA